MKEILSRFVKQELVETIMQIIENAPNTYFVNRYFQWGLIQQDPDDNKFVDCAIAANAKYLVTHDEHYKILKNIKFPLVNIISAKDFKSVLEKKSTG